MARPRKTLETTKKHLTKAEKELRAASEAAYKVGREQLMAFEQLEGLSSEAREEYERIATIATWLDDLDRNDLVSYCVAWDRARRIAASPDAKRELLASTRVDGSKKLLRNPLWLSYRECTAEMRSISLKLGLSTIDRLKLVAPKAEDSKPENKFLKYLRREKE